MGVRAKDLIPIQALEKLAELKSIRTFDLILSLLILFVVMRSMIPTILISSFFNF
jgi:hypothetical protein